MRLTQTLKTQIIHKFVEHTFSAREKVLNEEEHQLVYALYNAWFSKETQIKMNALPEGWLPNQNRFWVNAGGYSLYLNLPEGIKLKIPYHHDSESHTGRYNITDHDLIKKIQKHAGESEKLRADKTQFRNKMHSFLYSITTDGKLAELMPESKEVLGEKFFKSDIPSTALVTTAKEILCLVAQQRGEDREGCKAGKLVSTKA